MAAYLKGIPETSVQLTATSSDAANILYTCPNGVHARIDDLSFLNTSATDYTVSVHIVRSGGTLGVLNKIWGAAPVPKLTTAPKGVICYEAIGKLLNPGDSLIAFASFTTVITPMGSVVEFA